MRDFRVISCLLWCALSPIPVWSFPKQAQFHITGPFNEVSSRDPESYFCTLPVTVKQIRARFRSFHRSSWGGVEGEYSFLECGWRGTLVVQGKKFLWSSFVGEVMTTTYPNGKEHVLVGKPDDKTASDE